MNRYKVDISPAALEQIEQAFYFIQEHPPQNARSWLVRLYHQIDALETMPERFGEIRENAAFDVDLREPVHFSHRDIFTVDDERQLVRVVAVRHGARDEMREE